MKSIIQEASSIAKAIEQGLEKAGNPKDFSVKILEYPEKNFFRLTTRSAKIALYWDEKTSVKRALEPFIPQDSPEQAQQRDVRTDVRGDMRQNNQRDQSRDQYKTSREPRERLPQRDRSYELREQREPREPRESRERYGTRSHDRSERQERAPRQERTNQNNEYTRDREHTNDDQTNEPRWNDEMKRYAHEWLSTIFRELGRPDIMIAVSHENYLLRVMLDHPFTTDHDRERKLFASLALLLIEALKRKYRINLRGHKVVITHH